MSTLVPQPAAGPARRLLAPLGTLAGVAAAFTYVGLVDPNHPGHYPVCPLYALTGLYCPGCGGLRCAHAVARGDLATALTDNALAVAGFGAFAVVWLVWSVRAWRGVPGRIAVPTRWWWAVGAAVAVFTVVRNLPVGAALVP